MIIYNWKQTITKQVIIICKFSVLVLFFSSTSLSRQNLSLLPDENLTKPQI